MFGAWSMLPHPADAATTAASTITFTAVPMLLLFQLFQGTVTARAAPRPSAYGGVRASQFDRCRRRSKSRQAAVDGERLAGHVDALVGHEEEHGICDLPAGRLAAERDRRARPRRTAGAREPPERRVDEARAHDVGANAAA